METGVIYTTEKSVLKEMKKKGIKRTTLYITAFIDPADNYQKFGYSVENIDKGYYKQQNALQSATKTFEI